MVIPVGGMATRFRPLSLVVPKHFLPLGDRPLIHHAVDEAAEAGFDGVVIVTSPAGRKGLERYLGAVRPPLSIEYAEQPTPLGIGDAVLRAAPIAGDRFGVLLPDDVVTVREHWRHLAGFGGPALCFRRVPADQRSRFGIGVLDGDDVAMLVEKPAPGVTDSDWAIFGRYVVTEAVLAALTAIKAEGELQLTYGFAAVQGVKGYRFGAEIFDCGTPESYRESWSRWPSPPPRSGGRLEGGGRITSSG
jgi:UTP--glucose-1-phosphate uridylyltransferase